VWTHSYFFQYSLLSIQEPPRGEFYEHPRDYENEPAWLRFLAEIDRFIG
jgi:hypothetical protein